MKFLENTIRRSINWSVTRNKKNLSHLLTLTVLALPLSAQALTIHLIYDSSVTNLTNAAEVEGAFSAAVQTFQSLYTNPITVNITVEWGNSDFGNSGEALDGWPSYAQITNALKDAAKTVADRSAVASLPPSDPITSQHVYWIPRAEAKALTDFHSYFLLDPNDTNIDGSVSFASNISWTFDPTNRAVAGKYDFIGIAEHEISEALGRCSDLNYDPTNGYVPNDLFRFTNNGARSFGVNDSGVYFSINNGLTALRYFNAVTNLPVTTDVQDWELSGTSDACDFALVLGQKAILSSVDLTALDIIGYDLNFKPPNLSGVWLTNGNFKITFTNVTGLGFVVLANTNLSLSASNWTTLGTPIENPVGQYQFIDAQAKTNKTRFYRVSLP